jgi:hypothetical protein
MKPPTTWVAVHQLFTQLGELVSTMLLLALALITGIMVSPIAN